MKTIANNAVVSKTLEKQTRKTKCVRLKKTRGTKNKKKIVFLLMPAVSKTLAGDMVVKQVTRRAIGSAAEAAGP